MEKTRENIIPSILNNYKRGIGVELGVFKGYFSKHLLSSWDGRLYMIDPWRPLGDEYSDISNHKNHQTAFAETMNNIQGMENRGFMLRGLGEEIADIFEVDSLDFVYIDANHAYDFVKKDLEIWYPKLKKGGLFAGHDYLNIDWANDNSGNYKLCENGKDREIRPPSGDPDNPKHVEPYFAGVFGVNPAVDEFCKMHNQEFSVTEEFWGSWYFIK